jgi:hypothetical protein
MIAFKKTVPRDLLLKSSTLPLTPRNNDNKLIFNVFGADYKNQISKRLAYIN